MDEKKKEGVTELTRGEIEYVDAAGKAWTYYPANLAWMDVQDLRVCQGYRKPEVIGDPIGLTTSLLGSALLHDYSISVIGEQKNITRTLDFAIFPGVPEEKMKDMGLTTTNAFVGPYIGAASIGFNREDWESGVNDSWWVCCYLPIETIRGLCDQIANGQLSSLSLAVQMKYLYQDDHSMAPVGPKKRLFLRPHMGEGSLDWPTTANGYVDFMQLSLAKVTMTPKEVEGDLTEPLNPIEPIEPAPKSPDPVAQAVNELTATVASLKTTLIWVGLLAVGAVYFIARH